jgi:ubiquinone/menaquinone biosynthesis C-methylase UbiE
MEDMMKNETLALLQDPRSGSELEWQNADRGTGACLVSRSSGETFRIRDGIPDFTSTGWINGTNQKYQRMYDRLAPLYDLTTVAYAAFKLGGDRARVMEYLQELEIKAGDRVLETSIGTGRNVQYLPRNVHYYGIDISWGMLRNGQRKARQKQIDLELFLCPAESLCFRDNVFDVVYHVGGINYFNDPGAAVREMVRVARPGTRMIIVDETEEVAQKLENVPGASPFYKGREKKITSPVEYLPPEMQEVRLKTVARGELYCLSFRKPL